MRFKKGETIEVILNPKTVNAMAILFGSVLAVALLLLYIAVQLLLRGGGAFRLDGGFLLTLLLFFINYMILILLHELVHGIAFKLLGGSGVKYGFDKRHLLFYAHALQPMPVRAYRWAVALPTLLLALPMLVAGLALPSYFIYLLGLVMAVGGIGDAAILQALRPFPTTARVVDHATKPGCIVKITE